MPSMWRDIVGANKSSPLTVHWLSAGCELKVQGAIVDAAAKAGQCQAIIKDGKGPQCSKAAKTDGLCTQHIKMGERVHKIVLPRGMSDTARVFMCQACGC